MYSDCNVHGTERKATKNDEWKKQNTFCCTVYTCHWDLDMLDIVYASGKFWNYWLYCNFKQKIKIKQIFIYALYLCVFEWNCVVI